MDLKMDMLLAKAGPMGEAGNASVMTYLRSFLKVTRFWILVREEEEVRTCEGKQHGATKVREKGGGAEMLLQAVVRTVVQQLCPCSPRGMQRSTHSPWGRCPCRSGWMPGGGCDPVADPLEREGPASRLEQPVLGGLHPEERESPGAAVREGRVPVGGAHAAAGAVRLLLLRADPRQGSSGELSPMGGTPRPHRGRLLEQRKEISAHEHSSTAVTLTASLKGSSQSGYVIILCLPGM
ncbi:uncharacterized protein [Aphelocoma coerulescens]|uniref:uncharacterized protein isoform X2 n=1 Tax=Aphelocoma coerulescens TaxID=39617 RepID=UPI003604F767